MIKSSGMSDKLRDQEDAEVQALRQRLTESEEHKRDLEARGWVWRGDGVDRVLSLPNDPDVNIWFHPYTGEQLLSPKLVEKLKQDISGTTQ